MKIAGGVAAALLAGFSLTAVVQLVTLGTDAAHPPLAGMAVGAFAVAAALLLQAMVFSSIAVGHAATPGQYLDAYPEAARAPCGCPCTDPPGPHDALQLKLAQGLFSSWKDEGPEVEDVASSVAYRALFSDNARAEATLFELRRVADLLERKMKQ